MAVHLRLHLEGGHQLPRPGHDILSTSEVFASLGDMPGSARPREAVTSSGGRAAGMDHAPRAARVALLRLDQSHSRPSPPIGGSAQIHGTGHGLAGGVLAVPCQPDRSCRQVPGAEEPYALHAQVVDRHAGHNLF